MPDQEFSFIAGALCLDFVNTASGRGTDQERERIPEYQSFLAWAEEASAVSGDAAGVLRRVAEENPDQAERAVRRAHHLRESLFRLFVRIHDGEGIESKDLDAVNRYVRRAGHRREVRASPDAGYSWDWDARTDLELPLWAVALSAADLLVDGDLGNLKQCDEESCEWLFVDTSKNKRRRWCDASVCGNRYRVRKHYRRTRS